MVPEQALQQAKVVAKNLFNCSICGRDLLLNAAQVAVAKVPNTTNALVAVTMMQEPMMPNDPLNLKKVLRLGTASELDLNQFIQAPSGSAFPPHLQKQLQGIYESGRVLLCFPCFESLSPSHQR